MKRFKRSVMALGVSILLALGMVFAPVSPVNRAAAVGVLPEDKINSILNIVTRIRDYNLYWLDKDLKSMWTELTPYGLGVYRVENKLNTVGNYAYDAYVAGVDSYNKAVDAYMEADYVATVVDGHTQPLMLSRQFAESASVESDYIATVLDENVRPALGELRNWVDGLWGDVGAMWTGSDADMAAMDAKVTALQADVDAGQAANLAAIDALSVQVTALQATVESLPAGGGSAGDVEAIGMYVEKIKGYFDGVFGVSCDPTLALKDWAPGVESALCGSTRSDLRDIGSGIDDAQSSINSKIDEARDVIGQAAADAATKVAQAEAAAGDLIRNGQTREADRLIESAKAEADRMMGEARAQADRLLGGLKTETDRMLQGVQDGLGEIRDLVGQQPTSVTVAEPGLASLDGWKTSLQCIEGSVTGIGSGVGCDAGPVLAVGQWVSFKPLSTCQWDPVAMGRVRSVIGVGVLLLAVVAAFRAIVAGLSYNRGV